MKLLLIFSVDFDITVQLLITLSAFSRYWRKKWEYNKTVHQLFIDFKKAYGFSEERSIVQYSHKIWGTHETM
jgi:hypothetical protein